MEFMILKAYRDNKSPKLFLIGEKLISSFKKEELIEYVSDKYSVKLVELCRVGELDPNHENVVSLTQHEIDQARAMKRPAPSGKPEQVTTAKKARETSVDTVCEMVKLI